MAREELRSRLAAHLAGEAPEHAMGPLGPLEELTGGWASSLYTFTVGPVEPSGGGARTLVLKLYDADERGRQHATREWRALTRLRAMGHLVPAVVAFEPELGPLGRPFLVMNRIAGTSLWSAIEAADPRRRAELTRSFVQRLVALHALDPQGLQPTTTPPGSISWTDHELAGLRRDGENSPHTQLVPIVEWLHERMQSVSGQRPVILHRDYHPWNVIIDGEDRLWVLDWDWRIGDARFDLAWTCTLMQRSGHHTFSTAVQEEYARQAGRPVDAFASFEVLTTLRWLLNVLPAVGPHSRLDPATRADFRAFLLEPVDRAQTLLHDRTGIAVTLHP